MTVDLLTFRDDETLRMTEEAEALLRATKWQYVCAALDEDHTTMMRISVAWSRMHADHTERLGCDPLSLNPNIGRGVWLRAAHEAHIAAVRECRETIHSNYVRRCKATQAAASEAMLEIW